MSQETPFMSQETKAPTRRQFIQTASTTLAAFGVAPGILTGAGNGPLSERLNVAFIGAGGRGASNLRAFKKENVNIVAFADVDDRRGAPKAYEEFPKAERFRDFRKMLDNLEKSIDAVVVSTPDHTHAVACLDAISRGKHVYCEKPLAHSIFELRALARAAREKGVVTQLGNQGHSYDSIRQLVEWVRDGAIGKVHTVHASAAIVHNRIDDLPRRSEKHALPEGLDWDLWLGPAAYRDYHPMYMPSTWRAWRPFGGGTIGDWVCHVLDGSFWALDLGAPESVTALKTEGYDPIAHADTFPRSSVLHFVFPAKGDRDAVDVYWYDGTERLPRPRELEADRESPKVGAALVGTGGTILHGSHGSREVRLIPEARMQSYKQPDPSIPRVKGGHRSDFVQAIVGGTKAGSDFAAYGAPLTEVALLGLIAQRFPGRRLTWDSENMRFTDCKEANLLVSPPQRKGWEIT